MELCASRVVGVEKLSIAGAVTEVSAGHSGGTVEVEINSARGRLHGGEVGFADGSERDHPADKRAHQWLGPGIKP